MADRGNQGGGRGQGRFQRQALPNRGGSQQGRGNYGNRGGGSARGQYQGRGRGGGGQGRIFRQDNTVYPFSPKVLDLENKTFQQGLVSATQNLSLQGSTSIPKRPAYGSKGRQIRLWANYFELLPSKTSTFNRYDVSMSIVGKGEEPKGKKLERCMDLLVKELPTTISIATDRRKTLISSQELPFKQKDILIKYSSETDQDQNQGPGRKSPQYRARVRFTGTFTFADLLDYLSSTNLNDDGPTNKEEIMQAANIIIGSQMKSNSKIITKNNKYFPTDSKGNFVETWMLQSGLGLKAFRGFFMSVRAATGRILLNVQVQYVATWKSQSMLDLLKQLLRVDRKSMSEVHHTITGLIVTLRHFPGRMKRVAGLALQNDGRGGGNPPRIDQSYASADQVRFWRTQPEPAQWVTVADYFNTTYGPKYGLLKESGAPLLNVGSKSNPTYIPSELCDIKDLQTYDRKLPPADTTAMSDRAVRHPADNAQIIANSGMGLLRENSKAMLNAFGIGVNPSMVVVKARVLEAAGLVYQKRTVRAQDASWNMNNTKFNVGAKAPTWTYLWIKIAKMKKDQNGNGVADSKGGDFSNQQQVDQVVEDFRKTWEQCGCVVQKPAASFSLDLQNTNDPGPEVDNKFSQVAAKKIGALLVILPFESVAIYNAVKRAGDIKYGIHTVNVIADRKKFCKRFFQDPRGGIPNVQYHANVALKFNLKLGGRNQVLQDDDRGFIREGKTMLVGLDVTHPAPGSSQTAPSVSSITASIDSHLCQWPADVAIQSRSKEMIEGLKTMFQSRLVLWRKHQSQYPEEIIVYRDGVGDSMYELVRTQELPQIREACKEVYPAADTKSGVPYITIIICGKRHHTRFYPTDEKEADQKTGATKCGTVVDRDITEVRVWDFYLQAHTALKGTPRPAHYVVIHDEVFRRRAAMKGDASTVGQRAADEVERLTHAMCYMFGRATKAVSLCPPAYYADIVCERARVWLSAVFDDRSLASSQAEIRQEDVRVHPNLKDTMFYM